MAKEPILETERLVLRPLTVDDAEAVFEWTSDPRVAKYMSYPRHTDICQTPPIPVDEGKVRRYR